jgi:hypothetical protein
MEETSDERSATREIARKLAQGLAGVAAAVALLLILPSLPYALLAGMETSGAVQSLYAWTPLLLLASLVSGVLCMARFGVVRFVLAVAPVSAVVIGWIAAQ